jgi:hypothetical protein
MRDEDDDLTVDDLVTGKAAAQLGEGHIPTRAVLIVESMTEDGTGLRYVMSAGMQAWQALGMIRSVQLNLERVDLESWGDVD